MTMWIRTATIVFVSFISLCAGGEAAEFTRVMQTSQSMLLLTGDIGPDDPDRLRDIILGADDGRPITAIMLNSPGGNLVAGVAVAQRVRAHNLNTIIGPNAICASTCFLVFAAGITKYVDYASFVGVHGVADKGGAETADSKAATLAFARIIQELGAPNSIASKLLATPPQQIVRLTIADLRGMGVVMTGRRDRGRRDTPAATGRTSTMPIY